MTEKAVLFIAKTGYNQFTVYEVCKDCGYSHKVVAVCEDDNEAKRVVRALEAA